ncbi:MAG: SDR family oxidoreductase [Verrucomicrobiota bacterium]|nr:SDR family oxidoreductase [Verrucomicrobiota bacterium]
MNQNQELALITGAGKGIGRDLAREFARNGHRLILTSRTPADLAELAQELDTDYGIQAQIIAQDLNEENAVENIVQKVQQTGAKIDILVNNAGHGQRGNFWEIPLEKDLSMIRVNIEAVVRLTKSFLPQMLSRGSGRILNTASVAGFEPGPSLAIYHATKAFVLSFSEALATELQETGITVTALCPGPTDTDFFPKADMVDTNVFQKASVMSPQEVAKTAYTALMKGERVVVPGGMNKALVFSRRFLTEAEQAKMNEKFYAENEGPRKRERGDVEYDEKNN